MKRLLLLTILISFFSITKAQYAETSTKTKVTTLDPKLDVNYHTHKGFYLSTSLGIVGGSINSEIPNAIKSKYSGTGMNFDIKLGGAIKENLILHATIISSAVAGPTIKVGNAPNVDAPSDFTIAEAMIGAGLTYYIMPENIFISGSLGIGQFTVADDNDSATTDKGFSMQLKVGKEWWVSTNWGLGISASYMKTNLKNSLGDINEDIDSNRFALSFNVTFN